MFKVRAMRTQDFSFATKLANTMNWNMTLEDFQFMMSLEPEGCFVLFEGAKPAGIATCISFGKVGWFGNLIVKAECRKKGGGSKLVNHAKKYLRSKRVETIGLYAYPDLVNFYGTSGFTFDEDFSVLRVENFGSMDAEELSSINSRQFPSINRFDSECFGGDRKKLLESIIFRDENVSYFISDSDGVCGYVAATIYENSAWIGPLICNESRNDVSISLIKAVLTKVSGKSVYVVVSKKAYAIVDVLCGFGFKEDFCVSRMFCGSKVMRNCIYLAESLERG
jgi:N-acetylglutamate synthase-like GNAT family acetyltransferase